MRGAVRLIVVTLVAILAGPSVVDARPPTDTLFILMDEKCSLPLPDREKNPDRGLLFRDRMHCVEKSQKDLRAWLKNRAKFKTLAIANALVVEAPPGVRDQICSPQQTWKCIVATTGVFRYPVNRNVAFLRLPPRPPRPIEFAQMGLGTVSIGFSDTGFNWNHPDLKNRYRGNRGSNGVNHQSQWLDALGECNEPCDTDDLGHGTGVVGEALLSLPPDAPVTFFGCRDTKNLVGKDTDFVKCLDFLWAPPNAHGDADQSLGAWLVNVSGGCDPVTSQTCSDGVKRSLDTFASFGTVVVAAAGRGSDENSPITALPALDSAVLAVGGTNDSNEQYPTSPIGPDDTCKPDVVARATGIEVPTNQGSGSDYLRTEGTSFASPQVAAAVATVLSEHRLWFGRAQKLTDLIRQSAKPLKESRPCKGKPDIQVPNRVFGFGSVSVPAARNAAKGIPPP